MINQDFMRALAMLELAAASDKDRTIINDVRGRYVAKFGMDNQFVNQIAQLEAVAATDKEKAEINTIRGMFGLYHMTNPKMEAEDVLTPSERSSIVDDIQTNIYKQKLDEIIPRSGRVAPSKSEFDNEDLNVESMMRSDGIELDDPETIDID